MSTLLRTCGVISTAILVLSGLAAPAHAKQADATASTTPTGVMFAGCVGQPFTYSVTTTETTFTWSLELLVQAPDGTLGGAVNLNHTDPTSGVATLSFCPTEDAPGTYTVTGTYKVTDKAYQTTVAPLAPFTFDLRFAYARVEAKASDKTPRLGQRVKVNILVNDERPSGEFFPTSGAGAKLQRLKGTRWVGVGGAKGYTNGSGRQQVRFKNLVKGKTSYRVQAEITGIGTVTSSVFKLRTRG